MSVFQEVSRVHFSREIKGFKPIKTNDIFLMYLHNTEYQRGGWYEREKAQHRMGHRECWLKIQIRRGPFSQGPSGCHCCAPCQTHCQLGCSWGHWQGGPHHLCEWGVTAQYGHWCQQGLRTGLPWIRWPVAERPSPCTAALDAGPSFPASLGACPWEPTWGPP